VTEEQKGNTCYNCGKPDCNELDYRKRIAKDNGTKVDVSACDEYEPKPKKTIDLYEELRKQEDYLKTDSLEERLIKLQQMNFVTSFKERIPPVYSE